MQNTMRHFFYNFYSKYFPTELSKYCIQLAEVKSVRSKRKVTNNNILQMQQIICGLYIRMNYEFQNRSPQLPGHGLLLSLSLLIPLFLSEIVKQKYLFPVHSQRSDIFLIEFAKFGRKETILYNSFIQLKPGQPG